MENLAQLEQQLSAYIRDPDNVGVPPGVEPQRAKIYPELFYNNMESFISSGFPVLRSLMNNKDWRQLIRGFMVNHRCLTPLFLEVGGEFLRYLQEIRAHRVYEYPFILELAHYERVELVLDVADTNINDICVDRNGDLIESLPVVSPLARSLAYQYPVHKIGANFTPVTPPERPTYLVVYRNRKDQVKFMQTNAVTARLLAMLQSKSYSSGRHVFVQLAEEIRHPQPQQLLDTGAGILRKLHSLDIVLGVEHR